MSINQFLNYLDNQNTSPASTAEDIFDEVNFFIGTIFDILNEVNNSNQQNNTAAEETAFSLTQY